ncbi:hypothetical protein FGRMN_4677 [Fusarium graminum]|nr:hypothetical protein FGRMN_4677 [Fusarium graminum]
MACLDHPTPYTYSQLSNPLEDVRLIDLHPGGVDDDVKISIYQAPLRSSGRPRWQTVDLQSLRKTLPPDWWVYQDINGRIYFYYENDKEEWKSQWSHPDKSFDLSPYEITRTFNPVTFEALSYTWGDIKTQQRVALVVPREPGVSEPAKRLLIGPNLHCALRHLRFTDRPRTLWVDAVCINQDNISERDEQVKRMATIYKEAIRVVVWLGLATPTSSLAFRRLSFLGSQVVSTTDKWQFTAPGATEIDWCYNATRLGYSVKVWEAIDQLLLQPWFSRVWIVQEIQLAQEAVLCCGQDEMSWDNFRNAIIILWNKTWLDPALSRSSLSFIERLVSPITTKSSIYHILHRTDERGCQNKRDLLYGVLGLFPDRIRMKIQPQYLLPLHKVYWDFVRTHVQHVQRLELLRDCQGPALGDAPSWVPNYATDEPKSLAADWQFASGYSACQVVFKNDRELHAAGVHCGIIDIARYIPSLRLQKDKAKSREVSINAIRELVSWMKSKTEMDSTLWKTFARTLACNYLKDRFPDNRVDKLEDWMLHIESSSLFTGLELSGNGEDTISFQDERALGALLGRSFFVMEDGDIGIGPASTKRGKLSIN